MFLSLLQFSLCNTIRLGLCIHYSTLLYVLVCFMESNSWLSSYHARTRLLQMFSKWSGENRILLLGVSVDLTSNYTHKLFVYFLILLRLVFTSFLLLQSPRQGLWKMTPTAGETKNSRKTKYHDWLVSLLHPSCKRISFRCLDRIKAFTHSLDLLDKILVGGAWEI